MSLRRLAHLFLLCLVVAFAGGCSKSNSGSSSAQVRFMNALVDSSPITISVGSNTPVTGLPFEGVTGYDQVDAGTQEFKVSVAGGTSTIIDTTLPLNGDALYTYVVYGTASAPLAQLIVDQVPTAPNSGQFVLRVTNAAFGTAALDVYITAPGAPLDNASPNISNVAFNGSSPFATLTPGSFQIRFTLANSKQVIYDAGQLPFVNQGSYQMIAYTKGSGTLVNAALMNVDSSGAAAIVNSKIAQLKMVAAAPGTAVINTFVDSVVAFANVPYQGASSYSVFAAGTHNVTAESAATPGAVIASAQPPFAPATDTSFVVTGTPGAQTALVLNDNNLPGAANGARVRFVTVASNLGAVDVLVNFALKVAGLGTNAASSYVAFTQDVYSINFDLAGTTNVVLSMPAVEFDAGHTYTLYLVGTGNQLAGVLTRDD